VINALATNAPVKNATVKDAPVRNATVTKINVNGKDRELKNVPGETPLLWVLRDHLGLTGTKYGCGISECGACTVHLDGVAVQSCVTSLADVGDSKVVTIEGLSQHGDHPVQKAWIEHNVPQCGYCQAGQMMMAAALLSKKHDPSDKEIEAQMWNICRCGTYPRIRAAIKTAAKDMRQ
jgi:aerobic-type carbon monoxide dehydrogenase small subunit (CoxS/CutS family)